MWFLSIINIIFQIYMVMLLVRILSSWFPELGRYRFMQFISFYTDPYLNFFRRFVPPLGMFDFSPIIAFFCLQIVNRVVIMLLLSLIR